jgi:hypothetical protein
LFLNQGIGLQCLLLSLYIDFLIILSSVVSSPDIDSANALKVPAALAASAPASL